MSLLAYNLTGMPLTLDGGNPPPTLPASGEAMNVTAELRGLNEDAYVDLRDQQIDQVRYAWTGAPEYFTGLLQVQTAGGSGSTDVLYREGETNPTGNVYATFLDAWSAARAVGGPATIWFDDSLDDPMIDWWEGPYDLDGITLRGVRSGCNDNNVECDVADGATFTNFHSVQYLSLFYWGSPGNPAIVDMGRGGRALSITAGPTADPDFLMTFEGLSGMTEDDVGQVIWVEGADTGDNNAEYLIVTVLSSSSVQVQNENGVSPDVNNGSINWGMQDSGTFQSCTLVGAILADSGGGGWWDIHDSYLSLTMAEGAALWNDDDQVIHFDSHSLLVILASGIFTQIGAYTLSGNGGVILFTDSKVDASEGSQDIAGWDWFLLDLSSQIFYEPDDSGDWPEGSPSEVAEALDKLAARELGTPTVIVRSATMDSGFFNIYGPGDKIATLSGSSIPAGFRLTGVSFENVTYFDDPTHGSMNLAVVGELENVAHIAVDATAGLTFPQQGTLDLYFGGLVTGGISLVLTSSVDLNTISQGSVTVVVTGCIHDPNDPG